MRLRPGTTGQVERVLQPEASGSSLLCQTGRQRGRRVSGGWDATEEGVGGVWVMASIGCSGLSTGDVFGTLQTSQKRSLSLGPGLRQF